jgi:hypothetical protein
MRPGLAAGRPARAQPCIMKAILQATLAAILSGVLVGYLLKKKVGDLTSGAPSA